MVFKVFKNLRLKFGRKAVEPSMKQALIDRKKILVPYFSADVFAFENNDGKPVHRPMVYCKNVPELVFEIADRRDMNLSDIKLKVGIDKGRGQLKTVLSLYDPDEIGPSVANERIKRADGIGAGRSFSNIGRNKVILLATQYQIFLKISRTLS